LCLRKRPNGVGGDGFPVAPPIGCDVPSAVAGSAIFAIGFELGVAVGEVGAAVGAEAGVAGALPRTEPIKPREAGSHRFSESVRAARTPCTVTPTVMRTELPAAVKKSALDMADCLPVSEQSGDFVFFSDRIYVTSTEVSRLR
jgi:hypothetical protein